MSKNNQEQISHYNVEFCCEHMEDVLLNSSDEVVLYHQVSRSFSIDLRDGMRKELWYCPWCGAKLPKGLGFKWIEVLKDEYGIKDPIFDDADKVPAEFETDEWWKKRGL
jgi:hypothetical protein